MLVIVYSFKRLIQQLKHSQVNRQNNIFKTLDKNFVAELWQMIIIDMFGLLRTSLKRFSTTIFDKILNKSIPSQSVYEDEHIYAFKDVSPQAPVHILIIPKNKNGLSGISQAQQQHTQILGHMLVKVPTIASEVGLTNGYRLVINEGKEGCQTVQHLHIHLLGGRQMSWPPG